MSDQVTLEQVTEDLQATFSDSIIDVGGHAGDTLVHIKKDTCIEILSYLKSQHRFIYLSDIFGTDRFTADDRFEVIYNIVSLRSQLRLFVKIRCEEENPVVDSATKVWPAANWMEREVYDMFGIRFTDHPDMRRIYLPQDFKYFPLRKEFPLLGIPGSIELPNTTPDTE